MSIGAGRQGQPPHEGPELDLEPSLGVLPLASPATGPALSRPTNQPKPPTAASVGPGRPGSGSLTARQRVDLLLDPGSFLEIGAAVRHRSQVFGMAERRPVGDGVITGWGTIAGRSVYLVSQDFSVLGGSVGEAGGSKICRVQDLAAQNGVPLVALWDGGGGRIQEGVDALHGFSEILYRHARSSGVVPQIGAMMGPCAGGASYSASLMDFILMVEGTGTMSLTGPDVIRSVTQSRVTTEQIGGAEVHASTTGLAHLVAASDADCLTAIRQLLSFLPDSSEKDAPLGREPAETERPAADIETILPRSSQQSYDMRQLIRAVVDDGVFLELQAAFAQNLLVGFARLGRHAIGVVASQPLYLAGALSCNAAIKGARFVRFCDAFNIPVVTFVDSPGYVPSLQEELAGVIRHGAKLVFAYAEATVPLITLVTRKSYGGAYASLACSEMRADVNLAYPGAEVAVVGAEAAVAVLHRRELRQAGPDEAAVRRQLEDDYRQEFNSPFPAAERGIIDAVIQPRDTRSHLLKALKGLLRKRAELPRRKHCNLPL